MPAKMPLTRRLHIRTAACCETVVRNCTEVACNVKSGVTQYRRCLPFKSWHCKDQTGLPPPRYTRHTARLATRWVRIALRCAQMQISVSEVFQR